MDERSIEADFREYRETGDPAAMARVFDVAAPRLLLLAHHLVRDTARAEDLVQTVFLQVLEDATKFDDVGTVLPWMNGILRHRAIDARRYDQRREARAGEFAVEPTSAAEGPIDDAARRELFERTAAAIDELPARYRDVLVLRLLHGLEPTAIAHALGRAPGTVRSQLARGLERLREALPRERALSALGVLGPWRGLEQIRETVMARAQERTPPAASAPPRSGPQGSPDSSLSPVSAPVSTAAGTSLVGLFTMKTTWIASAAAVLLTALWIGSRPGTAPASAGAPDAERPPVLDRVVSPNAPLTAPSTRETVGASRMESRVADARITALVLGPGDAPLAKVGVYLREQATGRLGRTERTDEHGVVRFEKLAAGSWMIHIDRAPAASQRVTTGPRGETRVTLRLDGVDVSGTVVDALGAPVAGARVQRVNDAHHDYLQDVAVTGADGRFHLAACSLDLELRARAEGYQPSLSAYPRRGRDGTSEVHVELRLGASGNAVRGRVVDPAGRPAPYALVALLVDEDARDTQREPSTDRAPDREAFFTRADEEGRFETGEVPAGNLLLLARPLDETSALIGWSQIDIATGGTYEIDVHLSEGASVYGTVRDRSQGPAGGQQLVAEWEGSSDLGELEDDLASAFVSRYAVTDQDGNYRIAGLFPGEHDLALELGRDDVEHECDLQLAQGYRWDPVFEATADLRVQLVGTDDTPLPGWLVGHTDHKGRVRIRDLIGPTDENGEVVLPGLRRQSYQLTLHAPSGPDEDQYRTAPVTWRDDVYPAGDEVVVVRVEDHELPIAGFHGRWIDPSGNGIAQAGLRLEVVGWQDSPNLRTDDRGAFDFEGLPLGRYRLTTSGSHYPSGSLLADFEITAPGVVDLGDLVLPIPTRVSVQVVDPDGNPVEDPRLLIHPEDVAVPMVRDPRWEWDWRPERNPTALLWPGDYAFLVWAQERAPQWIRARIDGPEYELQISIGRGSRVPLRIQLPADAGAAENERGREEARIDVFVYDAEGRLLIDDRMDADIDRSLIANLDLFLEPGTYAIELIDHRRGVLEHASTQISLDVGPEDHRPLDVVLR